MAEIFIHSQPIKLNLNNGKPDPLIETRLLMPYLRNTIMTLSKKILLTLLPLVLNVPSHAADYIKSVHYEQTAPYPVIKVEGANGIYTSAVSNKITFQGEGKGTCKVIAYAASLDIWVRDANPSHQIKFFGNLPKKKKTSLLVPFDWTPDESTRNRAVQACNDTLKKIAPPGALRQQALNNGFETTFTHRTIRLRYHCYHFTRLHGSVESTDKPAQFKALCSKQVTPITTSQALNISSISLKPVISEYTGFCPKDFKFKGQIKSNGAGGKVRYRFKNHYGITSAWKNFTLLKGSTDRLINYSIKLQNLSVYDKPSLPNEFQGQGQQQVIEPLAVKENPFVIMEVENIKFNKKYSAKASFKYNCTALNPKIAGLKDSFKTPATQNKKADLVVLKSSFRLAGKKIKGFSLTIGSGQATKKVAGLCEFPMQYSIKNIGQKTAQPAFTTETRANGKSLHIANMPLLNIGHKNVITGTIKLKPGMQTVLIKTDHANKVDEQKEGNNYVQFSVMVKGSCDAASKPPRHGSTGVPAKPSRLK
ncbi:MAG: hypothetical protein COA95_04505 [Methylophaga sp.]|nr:MAG: hypothetical protein COA95_04505 [Methylophaga sp.]